MSMDDWAQIAKDIAAYYQKFNSFVILHGTDTMCYTASALSFMFEDLGKSVILTGAQVGCGGCRVGWSGEGMGEGGEVWGGWEVCSVGRV